MDDTMTGARLDRIIVSERDEGERLDRLLARALGIPRSHAQTLIGQGSVRIGGRTPSQSRRSRTGEIVEVTWVGPGIEPTPVPISILYQDEHLVVVDKPRGLPVHPVGRSPQVTVVSILLSQGPLPAGAPERPGVVHRLDAATTGALVVARTTPALHGLMEQFRNRTVLKEYLAVVAGEMEAAAGEIEGRLGREAARPWRMRSGRGRTALTEFQTLQQRGSKALLLVRPRTGRTHQIRVHLAAIGHPVVGDPLYGDGRGPLLLHAWRLGFSHPATESRVDCEAPPPPEFATWLAEEGSTHPR